MKLRVGILIVIVVLLQAFPIKPIHRVVNAQPLDSWADCIGWATSGGMHHTMSPWTQNVLNSGAFQSWGNNNTVIMAFTVMECGGQVMFAKFSNGRLVTNFFPKAGWTYVYNVVSQSRLASTVAQFAIERATGVGTAPIFPIVPAWIMDCNYYSGWMLPPHCQHTTG